MHRLPMNYEQFKERVVHIITKMEAYNPYAVIAICMIVAHESAGGQFWKQIGGGPALGIIQMEGWVHEDTWRYCDSIQRRGKLLGFNKDISKLASDLDYNIFMARCRLLMDSNPLPTTEKRMSEYLKEYWNSEGGKASTDDYLKDYIWWKNVDQTNNIF